MASPPVFVLGGHQTDFARNVAKEGLSVADVISDAVQRGLWDAEVPAADVGVAHVGNLAAELFVGQAQLGGLIAYADPALAYVPTARHEAACASGSIATLAAMADIESGRYDVALVLGVELMRGVDAQTAAEHLGTAAWAGREALDARFPWPALFSRIAEATSERYGLQHEHLLAISENNFTNARRNPNAQTRDWQMPDGSFGMDDDVNPVVEGMLRKNDCGRITDGAACVVLAGERYASSWAAARGASLDAVPRISGWGHRTAPMLLEDKLSASSGDPYLFPHLRTAITEAYGRAGVGGVADIDLVETHDCFSITEYVALDHLGLSAPGEQWKVVEDGTIAMGGSCPVNPSGGLIGLGHPVGATGTRMVLDAARQVSGRAGDMQVEGARRAATLNVGGSCTTVVSFVVEAAA